MRTLKLELPWVQIAFMVFALGLMLFIGIGSLVTGKGPPVLVTVLFFAMIVWIVYVYSGIPYRIEFDGTHEVRFVSLRNTVVVPVMEIESYELEGRGFSVLRYRGGKVRMLSSFTGFYELLAELKKLNPNFTVG